MRLGRARIDGHVVAVAMDGEAVVEIETELIEPEWLDDGADPLLAWIRSGGQLEELLARRASKRQHRLHQVQLLAPVSRPGKIIAVGLNYADHTSESGLEAPEEPLTFAKYPSSVISPGQEILVPTAVTTQVDWEAELALVIGRECGPARRGTTEDVAAYTVANDISARDLQFRDKQWTRAKSFDTFCPIGPFLVTPDEVPDPQALSIYASVNGEVMQEATTGDMIFPIAALLDFITSTVTLELGDVVLTGTPPGVGGFRTPPIFLGDGDVVEVGVDRVGVLRNPVRHL